MAECLVAVVQIVVDREIAQRRPISHRENFHVRHDHKTLERKKKKKKWLNISYCSLVPWPIPMFHAEPCPIEKLGRVRR